MICIEVRILEVPGGLHVVWSGRHIHPLKQSQLPVCLNHHCPVKLSVLRVILSSWCYSVGWSLPQVSVEHSKMWLVQLRNGSLI